MCDISQKRDVVEKSVAAGSRLLFDRQTKEHKNNLKKTITISKTILKQSLSSKIPLKKNVIHPIPWTHKCMSTISLGKE